MYVKGNLYCLVRTITTPKKNSSEPRQDFCSWLFGAIPTLSTNLKPSKMEYTQFLFAQLFMHYIENNVTQYKDFEYDLIFPEVNTHYSLYESSIYSLGMKSEYDCITEYLSTLKT